MTRQVRLRDVAERASVSVPTASRILKGPPDRDLFRPEVARAVEAAAEALGYRRNYHALALTSGRSMAIGLALWKPAKQRASHEGVIHGFWSALVAGIEKVKKVFA